MQQFELHKVSFQNNIYGPINANDGWLWCLRRDPQLLERANKKWIDVEREWMQSDCSDILLGWTYKIKMFENGIFSCFD